ncbi:hypothetical protein C1A40_03005 [Tamlana carrageenivorans]|uniref:Uncharacterized protein n=1 Tax=Pseudotamlana carrageenivorans TaxID=2069432 RepID=A0A2I7SF45_9FLAO|nr:hypothetical protein C1A40_03005 [Tamlana carrageenivorans]
MCHNTNIANFLTWGNKTHTPQTNFFLAQVYFLDFMEYYFITSELILVIKFFNMNKNILSEGSRIKVNHLCNQPQGYIIEFVKEDVWNTMYDKHGKEVHRYLSKIKGQALVRLDSDCTDNSHIFSTIRLELIND